MTNEENIKINPIKILNQLLKILSDREKMVLLKRHGLKGDDKQTLEQIGKSYNITRERVRQIERNSIKKLQGLDSATIEKSSLPQLKEFIINILNNNGGISEENYLVQELQYLNPKNTDEVFNKVILFTLDHLFDDIEKVTPTTYRQTGWRLSDVETELIDDIVKTITEIIAKSSEPLSDKEVLHLFLQTPIYQANQEKIMQLCDLNKDGNLTISEIFTSYLLITKQIRKNIFDKWGLTEWKTVQPQKINDKAYLVLLKAGKPLHFTDITSLINKAKFDSKVACPATVHNELILNDQYVLVGRGIYALKEWGYKEGTVVDVIYNVLLNTEPMTKEEIVKQVLKNRIVKKSTIYLSLLNKNKFKKEGNKYTVR